MDLLARDPTILTLVLHPPPAFFDALCCSSARECGVAQSALVAPKAMSAVFSAGSAEAKDANEANNHSKAFVNAMAIMRVWGSGVSEAGA